MNIVTTSAVASSAAPLAAPAPAILAMLLDRQAVVGVADRARSELEGRGS